MIVNPITHLCSSITVKYFFRAKIFKKIISGKGTDAQNNVVCANAGLAIATVNNSSHQNGFQLAKESLESGRAKKSLEQLIELSK